MTMVFNITSKAKEWLEDILAKKIEEDKIQEENKQREEEEV